MLLAPGYKYSQVASMVHALLLQHPYSLAMLCMACLLTVSNVDHLTSNAPW